MKRKLQKKRDPDCPKQPENAFLLFTRDVRAQVKSYIQEQDVKNPPLVVDGVKPMPLAKRVVKECGSRWNALLPESKQDYVARAHTARVQYQEQMREYKAKNFPALEKKKQHKTDVKKKKKQTKPVVLVVSSEEEEEEDDSSSSSDESDDEELTYKGRKRKKLKTEASFSSSHDDEPRERKKSNMDSKQEIPQQSNANDAAPVVAPPDKELAAVMIKLDQSILSTLECVICREGFAWPSQPLVLMIPCGHKACSRCIETIKNVCPSCQQPFATMDSKLTKSFTEDYQGMYKNITEVQASLKQLQQQQQQQQQMKVPQQQRCPSAEQVKTGNLIVGDLIDAQVVESVCLF